MLSTPSFTFAVCTWFPAGVWKVKNMAGCGSKGVCFKWFFMCLFVLHSPKLTFSPLKIGLFKRPKKETRPSSELLGVVQHLADRIKKWGS